MLFVLPFLGISLFVLLVHQHCGLFRKLEGRMFVIIIMILNLDVGEIRFIPLSFIKDGYIRSSHWLA